jgi:hypothetical protein
VEIGRVVKMILIAHRGNIEGPNPNLENKPDYINLALNRYFDVEIDVWYLNKKFYLGHDEPKYRIDSNYLINPKIWCHAKNIEGLHALLNIGAHCFWHQSDDVVLTSKNYIWTYPGKKLTKNSICVIPEITQYNLNDIKKCAGICTDYPERYKNDLQL